MAAKKSTKKRRNFLQRYWRETVGELRKVSWPTRKEAINLTIIVCIVILLMTLLLGSLDFFFNWLLSLIIG